MSFLKATFTNMPSIRKRRVQFEEGKESTKTNGSKRLKSGKIQKYSSSSESESDDDTPKNKISPKKQTIQRKSLTKKDLKRTRKSSTPESSLEDSNLKTNEGTEQLKETSSKNLGINHSSDSDEPRLVINEDSDDDLEGVQKFMKENFKTSDSSPSKTKPNIPDVKSNLENKSPQKNDSSPSKSKHDILGVKSNSRSKSPQKNGETPKNDEGIETRKQLFNDPKVDSSDSDSDVPGTQETIKKVNHSKNVKTEIDVKKKSNVTSSESESESDHEEKKQTVITGDIKKDEISKKSPIKNSDTDHSESDIDVEGTQTTVNTANHDQILDVKTKLSTSKKLNLVASESESDDEDKQKTFGEFKTDAKPSPVVNKNSNIVRSESESDIEGSQEMVNRRKNRNEDLKTDASANGKSIIAALESESDLKEKQEIDVGTENLKKDAETQKDANKNSRASSSESDQEEKHNTIKTSNKDENMVIDVQNESNLNTAETKTGEAVAKDLKNTCDLPLVSHDLDILSKLKEKKCSDSSDYEFSLEIGSSHEEKEQESSDTGKPKIPNRDLQKKSRVFRKKTFGSYKKIPTPPPEVKKEPEVSSDDSAEEEDLNEMGVSFNNKTYKPTEEERSKLANMIVKLRYPVRPQHNIESTAGTRTMTEIEREEFEQHATLKFGYFSPEEDKQIKKNWKTFCRDNDWDPKKPQPFLFMKHKNKVFLLNQQSRKRFMQGLAHGLDNRCLYSVFQRFKILFEPHRTCRYESDEDRKILDYVAACEKKKMEDRKNDVNEKDRKFAELAVMLRRTRASVWRRYRVLKKKVGQESKDNFCHSNK